MIESETVYFHLKADSLFIPHVVSLKYTDTINHFPYKRLAGFKNPFLNKTINSFFYIDKGVTTIGTYYNDSNFINSFSGSKQNEPYLKNISLFYRENDTVPDKQIELRNIEIIRKFPYSLYLLNQLFYYKEHFSNNELHALLAYFDADVKNTAMYKSFYSYSKGAANFDKAYPAGVQLQDTLDIFSQIGNNTSPFNLFVFWASWCGPCRKEIPQLKKLYALYNQKGLVISSISIDDDKESWKTALRQERMPWNQFIAIDSTKNLIDMHYNIHFIPKAYLFDKQKNLIAIFNGKDSVLLPKMETFFNSTN